MSEEKYEKLIELETLLAGKISELRCLLIKADQDKPAKQETEYCCNVFSMRVSSGAFFQDEIYDGDMWWVIEKTKDVLDFCPFCGFKLRKGGEK